MQSAAREQPTHAPRHRWPATEPITLEALGYGRHAAPERWLPQPPRPVETGSRPTAGAGPLPAWWERWRAVRDLAVRVAARRTTASPARAVDPVR